MDDAHPAAEDTRTYRYWSGEDLARLAELHAEGMPYADIAVELGRHRTAIARKASSIGLTRPRTPAPVADSPAETDQAPTNEQTPQWQAFELAVDDLHEMGEQLPCAGDDRHTSDDHRRRAQALAVCEGCPLLTLCAAAAESTDERFGVWAGVDLRRAPSRERRDRTDAA